MKIRKAIKSKSGTRLKVDGRKRVLVRDHIKKQAALLPKMHTGDGKDINHYARMKELYRTRGEEGVNAYIKACRNATRRYIWQQRLIRWAIRLKLISAKRIETKTQEATQ